MKEIKHLDRAGIEFLIQEEGLRLKPYCDSKGVPTIGFGNTFYENGQPVRMTDPPISKARAMELFSRIAPTFEAAVWGFTRDDINQHQFNALFALAYNIGVNGFRSSTVVKRVNANPNDPRIAAAFMMWRNSGKDKGILLARRKREASLYFS